MVTRHGLPARRSTNGSMQPVACQADGNLLLRREWRSTASSACLRQAVGATRDAVPGRSAIIAKPAKGSVTISQVAAAVGVNRSSVSRAFSRPEMLNAETVARIMEAAERLGYTPHHSARALSTGRHGNVALVVPDVANPFFPPMIRAVQNEADHQDYCVFLGY